MNQVLKAVYVCVTNQNRWGKGFTIVDAKHNAGLRTKTDEKRSQFYVQAAVFNEPTDEELENLRQCITVNQIDGSPMYYQDDRRPEDTKMIIEKHIGWLMVEKNF